MKTAVSIPDELFTSAEALGHRLSMTRSRLYATALADFVAKHQSRKITGRLDAVYAAEDGGLDATTRRLQARSLTRDSW
jgi:predicted transcriptional regulator